MYIDLIRKILEQAVDSFAIAADKPVSEILDEIRTHIDQTAKEHQKDEPDIDYANPLCRLGYLYRHATANATLFEMVLKESGELRTVLRESANGRINVCAVGGGPGTELLGLAKFLLRRARAYPSRITFTVLDVIPQWAETWQQLADAVEHELQNAAKANEIETCPVIVPAFIPFDVLKAESYVSYPYQFGLTKILIFNYLFSENKTRLKDINDAIKQLISMVPRGCVIVVIDRLENNSTFQQDVVALLQKSFNKPITCHGFRGTLDGDEQSADMGELFNEILGNPRVKFFTDLYRNPTVFWFTVIKE